jgi:hypothetical protein
LHDVNKLKRPTTVETDVFFEQFSQGAIWISYNTKRMHVTTTIKNQQEGDRTRESKQEHRSNVCPSSFSFPIRKALQFSSSELESKLWSREVRQNEASTTDFWDLERRGRERGMKGDTLTVTAKEAAPILHWSRITSRSYTKPPVFNRSELQQLSC